MNNYEKLCNILKTNTKLITKDGALLKNKVQELARKMDSSLLETLLSNGFTKEMFFTNINGIEVFDVNKFTHMVESQAFLPDSYTRFKQSVMLTDGIQSIQRNGDVVLEFPNKDCVLEFDSTDTNTAREETFLNETLMKNEIDTLFDHKAFMNVSRYDSNGVGVHPTTDFNMNDNLIIKGNNLLALHTLYPKYKGQIKLMYWDVLYNTSNDQVPYNDSFKHSSWLTMMKNRLEIAQKLLRDDGIICMQCDDNEQAYLTVLCDEIFGRDNHLNTIVVEMASTGGLKRSHKDKKLLKTKEYILVYSKTGNVSINPVYDEMESFATDYNIWFDGSTFMPLSRKIQEELNVKCKASEYLLNSDIKKFLIANANSVWRSNRHKPADWINKPTSKWTLIYENDNLILFKVLDTVSDKSIIIRRTKNNNTIDTDIFNLSQKIQKTRGKVAITNLRGDLWKNFHKDMGNVNKEGNVKLSNGKKVETLVSDIIEIFTNENDIVLDAYLGSGTTAAVAHKMNRRYIGIEQLDSHIAMSLDRLQNVIAGEQTGISKSVNWHGGGSFVYVELAKNSQTVIDRIINATDASELLSIYDELKSSPFVLYKVDIQQMEKEKNAFASLTMEGQKKFLISIIDKNTLYINAADLDEEGCSISDNDKTFTENFYKED